PAAYRDGAGGGRTTGGLIAPAIAPREWRPDGGRRPRRRPNSRGSRELFCPWPVQWGRKRRVPMIPTRVRRLLSPRSPVVWLVLAAAGALALLTLLPHRGKGSRPLTLAPARPLPTSRGLEQV